MNLIFLIMGTISLNKAFERDISNEIYWLNKIDNPIEKEYSLASLSNINRVFFLYSYFYDKNLKQSKNHLYKVAMCKAFYIEMAKLNAYEVLNTFIFPVLSDSTEVIERYKNYPFPKMEYAIDSFNTRFAQAIQSILRDDYKSLEQHIEILYKRSRKGWEKQYIGGIIAFEGLLLKNKEQIEYGIYELLKTHHRQNHNSIDSNYINYEATGIAKLAYRKGFEVQINSPLVPFDLLPIEELDEYEKYDFFKSLT